jgi:hypothetical protein
MEGAAKRQHSSMENLPNYPKKLVKKSDQG